jgi:hypothetical protein
MYKPEFLTFVSQSWSIAYYSSRIDPVEPSGMKIRPGSVKWSRKDKEALK